jgi:hypothetical protein
VMEERSLGRVKGGERHRAERGEEGPEAMAAVGEAPTGSPRGCSTCLHHQSDLGGRHHLTTTRDGTMTLAAESGGSGDALDGEDDNLRWRMVEASGSFDPR